MFLIIPAAPGSFIKNTYNVAQTAVTLQAANSINKILKCLANVATTQSRGSVQVKNVQIRRRTHTTPLHDLCQCNRVGYGIKRLIFWVAGESNSKSAARSISEREQRSLAGHRSLWTPVTAEISAIIAEVRFPIELLLVITPQAMLQFIRQPLKDLSSSLPKYKTTLQIIYLLIGTYSMRNNCDISSSSLPIAHYGYVSV